MSKIVSMRQGDVMLVACDESIPAEATEKVRDNGRIVLAYGEVTGHAHAVVNPFVRWLEWQGREYLVSGAPFEVVHEEHATVALPAGTFQVIRQYEFTPELPRMVAD